MIKNLCKWIVFKIVYPICYFFYSRKKIQEKKVVFVENHQESLTDNFQLLYNWFYSHDYLVETHYLKIATSSWKDIIVRSLNLIKEIANAHYIFLNESNSLFGAFSIRKETKLIQLWHACGAFKKWGFSVANQSFGENEKDLKKYAGHINYSLVPVSGSDVVWAYEEAFGFSKNSGIVCPLGVSRTDVFFDNNFKEDANNKFRDMFSNVIDQKIILYAPTFRGDIKDAKSPTLPDLDSLYQNFHHEYIVIIKQHPFVRDTYHVKNEYRTFCKVIGQEMTMEELMMVADICITDYSSIVFEFSLMCKPILFFAFDLESYYNERGFYYDYEEFVPGPIVKNAKQLIENIKNIEKYDYQKLETFRNRFMSGCDGHSTERILNNILEE